MNMKQPILTWLDMIYNNKFDYDYNILYFTSNNDCVVLFKNLMIKKIKEKQALHFFNFSNFSLSNSKPLPRFLAMKYGRGNWIHR